jgi:hypothetical protein
VATDYEEVVRLRTRLAELMEALDDIHMHGVENGAWMMVSKVEWDQTFGTRRSDLRGILAINDDSHLYDDDAGGVSVRVLNRADVETAITERDGHMNTIRFRDLPKSDPQ